MAPFELATAGDHTEQIAWPAFLRHEFPQYEVFWQLFVVELTGRVKEGEQLSIGFRPQGELNEIGRPAWHVVVAQLHYTTLLHLDRVFELRRQRATDRDSFIEAIARLSAATDTAFELLGRCLLKQEASDEWNRTPPKKIRECWAATKKWPLKLIRQYRNDLLHGRLQMAFSAPVQFEGGRHTNVRLYPRFERFSPSPDWREADSKDVAPADQLLDEAWEDVLSYFRKTWDCELLEWGREHFKAPEQPTPKIPFVASEGIQEARAVSAESLEPYPGGSATTSGVRIDLPRPAE